jgi:L-iditol 2-dehydrogenase
MGETEVLVRIAAATTCGTDLKVFLQGGHARMITPPAVFGHEFSGTIVAVGTRVTGFREGMRIVANNSAPCHRCYYCLRHLPNLCDDLLFFNGAYAEYIVVPERVVHTNLLELPETVSFPVACLTEPLACVLHCLDHAALRPGDTVVVNGDGPSGLMLAAMAKWRGARVILCGRAAPRLALASHFGADAIVNYAEVPDQVEAVRVLTDARRGVDVAIEAVGRPEVWEATVAMVRKGGQAIFYGGCRRGTSVHFDTHALHYDQLTLQGIFHNTPYHVRRALQVLADGLLPGAALITHTLPLVRLPEAFDLMISRHALKVALLP